MTCATSPRAGESAESPTLAARGEPGSSATARINATTSAPRQLKVLLICDRYPFPLHNGQNLRIYHYVTRLRHRHSFDLLCEGEGEPPKELNGLFGTIEHFPPAAAVRRRGWDRIRHGFSVTRMFPHNPAVRTHLEQVLPERNYDVIWLSGWGMVVNLPANARGALLADAVDDGVLEYWREFRRARTIRKLAVMGKWLLMNYRFERHYFGPAAHCLFVSEVDAASFHRVCPTTPVSVIHNGVDERAFAPAGLAPERRTIVFEGRMSFRPNADGIVAFCNDVLPRIHAAVPDVRVQLVGMDPPAQVRALASSFIEVTGFVDDVRPYLERAAVFICPLRKGAGIKNKVLQAWSMGKAVVATPASVGGLMVEEGMNIIVRPLDDTFADAVIDCLRHPSRAAAIGAAARQTILAHYTWERKAADLDQLLRDVAKAGRERRHA
jgi:polysaccharide biosynthesis protein PslH